MAAVSATLPVKPPFGVTVIELVPLFPLVTLRLDGEADNTTPGGTFTVRAIVVDEVNEPDVPVMVTVAEPKVAVALAVSVTRLDCVVGLVANTTLTPLGKPDATKPTLSLNPFSGVTVIVEMPCAPCVTAREAGAAPIVNDGTASPVPLSAMLWDV